MPRSGEGGLRRVGGREPEANKRSTLASANQPISSILFRKSRKHCGGTDAQGVLPSFVFPFAVPTSIAKPDYHSHCVPNTVSAEPHQQIHSIPLGSGFSLETLQVTISHSFHLLYVKHLNN